MPLLYIRLRVRPALAVLLPFLVILAGCGEPEPLPPEEVIERAVPAVQGVRSFHFRLETSKLDKPVPGFFHLTRADGDVIRPDKLSGEVSGTSGGIPVAIKVVVDGESQYMTDPLSGRWTTMLPSFNVVQFFDPTKGVSDILAGVKELRSDGTESVDGAQSYRLKGRVPSEALKSLSPEVTAKGELTTTLWIGAGDFLVRRVQLAGPILEEEPAGIVRTITVSGYNKEVKIETPVVK